MKRRKFYLYNPETDNFERFYPSIKDRLKTISTVVIIGLVLAFGFYFIIYYLFETPTVANLTSENEELKQELKQSESTYSLLERRLNSTMKIMEAIQQRDSNLYRVLLQMNPLIDKEINQEVKVIEEIPKVGKMGDAQLVARLSRMMDTLDRNLLHQTISFDQIKDIALNMRDQLDHTPAVLPIHVNDYTVSSGFGTRIDPVLDVPKFHAGLDMPAAIGTKVYATADGTVSFAGQKEGYGNCVDINHGYNYDTRYAHLSKILVPNGKSVKRGELIGLVGSTGKSTGPHLHYEVHFKNEPQNPVGYFFLDVSPDQYESMVNRANSAGHVMD